MIITAGQVKELREITGAGMMECKKALEEAQGNIEAAIELMRKKGQAKAAKKSGRITAEGSVIIAVSPDHKMAAMVEVNCETDFVGREAEFGAFVKEAAEAALKGKVNSVETLSSQTLSDGLTVEEKRQALIIKVGENVQVRRVVTIAAKDHVGFYVHGSRIGVVVDMKCHETEFTKSIAMHIAASKPEVVKPEEVSKEAIAKEKEIFIAQAAESGKPREIIEKMVGGRIKKYLAEVSLYGQPYVKDPNKTVEQALKEQGAVVNSFMRFEVGEGIEKRVDNFAEEVLAQARGG
ncbi:MAG: translation elongation factor Ts [Gammaproteobacteria bacterium RIFCSPHIGHO2_12_FULL_35_23]|nr:MAG: translation elongation factor Ts [Gammaproteobacteria bacterium RIFCSPHIGHO2_12_FULL_35_23]